MTSQTATQKPLKRTSRIAQYWSLTKPRVTQLAVFCAVIGMFLATDELPPWRVAVAATVGIWLLAGAAFAVNCLVEAEIDARMARTARRATAMGELTRRQTMIFSAIIGGAGMWVLYALVNPLTMWLTFVTSLVPVGPPMIWGGAAIWLFAQGSTGWGIFMLVWGLVLISGVDNVVRPVLISRGSSQPFLLTFLGVLGGVIAFGFVGMFLGPTLLAVGYSLISDWTGVGEQAVRRG